MWDQGLFKKTRGPLGVETDRRGNPVPFPSLALLTRSTDFPQPFDLDLSG